MKNYETRYLKIEQVRAIELEGKRTIGGYAAVFEKYSENLGMFHEIREKIQPGAFAESLQKDTQMAFWNHNNDYPIGSTKNGSLRLKEDSYGLSFELDLPDTQMGRDVYTNVKTGIIDGMSFGFRATADKVERGATESDPIIRTLIKGQLVEVSPVVYPAFPQTEVESRSLDELVKGKLAEIDKPIEPKGKPVAEFRTRTNVAALKAKLHKDIFGACQNLKFTSIISSIEADNGVRDRTEVLSQNPPSNRADAHPRERKNNRLRTVVQNIKEIMP